MMLENQFIAKIRKNIKMERFFLQFVLPLKNKIRPKFSLFTVFEPALQDLRKRNAKIINIQIARKILIVDSF